MEFILFMGKLALHILAIGAAFWIFGAILKNGRGTIGEIMQTLVAAIRVLCHAARTKMVDYLRREAEKKQGPQAEQQAAETAEGSVI